MKNMFCLAVCALGFIATCYSQCDFEGVWATPPFEGADGDYPNGFRDGIQIPNPEITDDDDFPCIRVQANNTVQYMEILIQTLQTTGSSRICIQVLGDDELSCGSGSASYCKQVTSTESTVTFTCDNGCDQSSTAIYYRANLSRSDIDDENWCSNRMKDYPFTLATFIPPSDITQQTQFTESALGLNSFSLSVLLLIAIAVLMVHQAIRI